MDKKNFFAVFKKDVPNLLRLNIETSEEKKKKFNK